MKKYIRLHLLALFGLTLLLVYQNCSSSGGQDLGTQSNSSFGSGNNINGYCQFSAGTFSSSPVTIYNLSTLPSGIITVTVIDPSGSYTSQNMNSGTTSFPYNYALTGTYLVSGFWQDTAGNQKPCSNTSFQAGTTDIPAPTCVLSFTGNPQVGASGTYSVSVSQSEPIYFNGILATTGTSYQTNHTFTIADQPTLSTEAHIVYNGSIIACGNSPLIETVESSSGGSGTGCQAAAFGQCSLPSSLVSNTPVVGQCSDIGNCSFTCTSSGWVQVRNSCRTNNN